MIVIFRFAMDEGVDLFVEAITFDFFQLDFFQHITDYDEPTSFIFIIFAIAVSSKRVI